MVGVFARRISYSLYFVLLIICVIMSASLGAYASNRQTFAHMSDEIYAFTGANVVQLTNAQLQRLGNPARVDCGGTGCINGIDTDGKITCYSTATRIFGAGKCIQVTRVIEEKKGSSVQYGYYCQANVPDSKSGCKSSTFWGVPSTALNQAIADSQDCCPGGTKVKKHNEGFYCEEG